MVGAGGGGVVPAAVQGLLWWWTAAYVAAVQAAGMLQDGGAKTQLPELIGGGHWLPGIRRLVVRWKLSHVRL